MLENKRILGEKLDFLKKYLSENFAIKFIYIYHDSDCGGCIVAGLDFLEKIDMKSSKIFILSDLKKYEKFNTDNFIVESKVDYFLENLMYIDTPVILKIDTSYSVLDAFFPGVQNNKNFKSFIEN